MKLLYLNLLENLFLKKMQNIKKITAKEIFSVRHPVFELENP